MAQERFWNFQDDDLTFRLDQWRLGIIDAGLYRGFDPILSGTMVMQLVHTNTGYRKTQKDGDLTADLGIAVMKQGVVVVEDASLSIEFNPTTTQPRIDYVVIEHDYIDVQGGTNAVYKVIQGPEGGGLPTLDKPNLQIIIGTLTLPANTTSLLNSGVIYSRAQSPEYGGSQGRYVDRSNGVIDTDLDAQDNTIKNLKSPEQAKDAANKEYVDDKAQDIIDSIQRATTTIVGITELATNNETITGTDETTAVTPASLSSRQASTTNTGLIELATLAEAINATSNSLGITPATLLGFLNNGNYVQDSNYIHTDNNFTTLLLDKLNGIQPGAEVNVQSDAAITDPSDDRYIRNFPLVPNELRLIGSLVTLRRNGVVISGFNLPNADTTLVNAFSGRGYIGNTGPGGTIGNISLSDTYNVSSMSRIVSTNNGEIYRINFTSLGTTKYIMNINFENVSTSSTTESFNNATLQWSIKRRGVNFVEIQVREDAAVLQNAYMIFSGRKLN